MGLVGPNFVGGTGALAFLLAAEVVAATAVVSEAALVYMARHRNPMISLAIIAVQAGLSFTFILFARAMNWLDLPVAAAPALSQWFDTGLEDLVPPSLPYLHLRASGNFCP